MTSTAHTCPAEAHMCRANYFRIGVDAGEGTVAPLMRPMARVDNVDESVGTGHASFEADNSAPELSESPATIFDGLVRAQPQPEEE